MVGAPGDGEECRAAMQGGCAASRRSRQHMRAARSVTVHRNPVTIRTVTGGTSHVPRQSEAGPQDLEPPVLPEPTPPPPLHLMGEDRRPDERLQGKHRAWPDVLAQVQGTIQR
jgi:hypothetical protein